MGFQQGEWAAAAERARAWGEKTMMGSRLKALSVDWLPNDSRELTTAGSVSLKPTGQHLINFRDLLAAFNFSRPEPNECNLILQVPYPARGGRGNISRFGRAFVSAVIKTPGASRSHQ